ncbi:MAG: DEAD/DEAH box helicase [Deltaproteobacteria bacterium]|nr:DEAD/DEAH box helicase [Deltaproteobacteria bacterium]
MIPSARRGPPTEPATSHFPGTLALGVPRAVAPAAGATCDEAFCHEIGWFDFSEKDKETLPTTSDPGDAGEHFDGRPDDLLQRLAAVLQPPLSAFFAPKGLLEWPAPLLPYQEDGIASLLQRRHLLLADDMGLGKTVQAIAALRILYHRGQIASALVVCPASLLGQWRVELRRWAPELIVLPLAGTGGERARLWRLPAHVVLVGYETLRADVLDLRDGPAARSRWGVVLLDEASRIKNRETGVSQACKRLYRERRWALTGTPLENSVDDLVSLFEFLTGEPGDRPRPSQTAAGARTQLREVQLRRRKRDVLHDLPPKRIHELTIELGPAQRASYDRAEREGIVRLTQFGPALTITHVLELIARLKQLCNVDPASGESAKLEDIEERLGILVSEGHRALVFSQFTDETFGLGRAVARLSAFAPIVYTGAMSSAQKSNAVDRFISDAHHKALLLSLRAGGVGLNLQAASYVFHLDRWWNPASEEQAESRAHRMGQPYPVTVFRYTCANTIEERIDQKLREKRELFQEVVDDVSLDLKVALTQEELFGLFGLPAPHAGSRSGST